MANQDTLVSITYQFIFSKHANIWQNVYDFEKDLSDFFLANNLEANVVQTVRGSTGGRIVWISKIEQTPKLMNMKGVNLKAKAQPSATDIKGLTRKISSSFEAQSLTTKKGV